MRKGECTGFGGKHEDFGFYRDRRDGWPDGCQSDQGWASFGHQ